MECTAKHQVQGEKWRRMSRILEDFNRSPHHPESKVNGVDTMLAKAVRPPRVCVVGAGISGLRCADVLVRSGAQVTVMEARNRIGGRVHQEKVGDRLVDLGANWIHGSSNNCIGAIAAKTGTVTHEWDGRQNILNSKGVKMPVEKAQQCSEFMWDTIEKAFAYSNDNSASIPAELSLLDFFKKELDKTTFDAEDRKSCIQMVESWGAFVGETVEKQSLRFFFLEECIEGTNLFVASTYKDILASIASTATTKAELCLNTEVTKIETQPRSQPSQGRVRITSAAGDCRTFDEVVVTCPLGWLKRNTGIFTPALPPRLNQAIENMSYGGLEKIYVTFPHAFWQDSSTSDKDKKTNGTTPNGSASTNTTTTNSATSSYPGFTHFLSPSYIQYPPGHSNWNQELVALSSLPSQTAHPTLLFYLFPPCSTYIVHNLRTIPKHTPEYHKFLNSFLHPYYSKLDNYTPSNPACTPTAFLATEWQSDPHAGYGSYTNFQTGCTHGDMDVVTIREGGGPLPEDEKVGPSRGLWFAGEHTSSFIALGTTTGAYWSGEGAARRICAFYGMEVVDGGDERDGESTEEALKGIVNGNGNGNGNGHAVGSMNGHA